MTLRAWSVMVWLLLFCSAVRADVHARRTSIARLASADLRAVHTSLAAAVASARRASPGHGSAGRTYEARAYRLGAASTDEALLSDVVHVWLHPDADDEAWFERIAPIGPDTAAIRVALGDAPDAPFSMPVAPTEVAARSTLADAIASAVRAHPALHALSLQCGWGDVIGGAYLGVVWIDGTTHEALWALSRETWRDE